MGVIATPWPNEPLARSIWAHDVWAGSRTRPVTSPARSMPVAWPIPNVCHVLYSTAEEAAVFLPSLNAACETPTLRDQATMSANDREPVALRSASATSWPPGRDRTPVSLILVVSRVVLESRAAEAVSILKVEPGSYTSLTTGSVKSDGSCAATCEYMFASYDGYEASASRAPVCGSITTAETALALSASHVEKTSCSTWS